GRDDGVSRLEEEERRLAAGEAHLLGVFLVVAAHAVDAVDGKAGALADDGDGGHRGGFEDVRGGHVMRSDQVLEKYSRRSKSVLSSACAWRWASLRLIR